MSARWPRQLPTDIQMEILEHMAETARQDVAELVYDDAWRRYARLLQPAILVNSEWAARGTDLLWREPFTPALAKIHPKRRQHYADKVQSLGLYLYRSDHAECPSRFEKLTFPKLKRLYIKGCPKWLDLNLRPYLSSSVTSFTLLECRHLSKSVLDLVAFCCPKLRSVHLDLISEKQGDEHFLRLLQKCRALRELILGQDDRPGFPNTILEKIMNSKHLEVFDAPQKLITYDSTRAILQRSLRLRPFRNLRSLFVNIESRAVASVLAASESLVDLRLSIVDSEYDVFGPVSYLLYLESLDLCFMRPKHLAIQELQAISRLTHLQELGIYRATTSNLEPNPLLAAEIWVDDSFEAWISNYPGLKKLHFDVQPGNSHWISETRTIAEKCPQLTELTMQGLHDIGAWRISERQLFPELQVLQLGQLKAWPFPMRYVFCFGILSCDRDVADFSWGTLSDYEAHEYAMGLARMIDVHAPMLTELRVGWTELGKAVTDAHAAIKASSAALVPRDTDIVMENYP